MTALKPGVQSAHLTLDVLEQIALCGEELGVTEIASRVGATKGSVYRHLTTLLERGYITQNISSARYQIGPKCRLLSGLGPTIDLSKTAEGPMRDLRDKLGHTVVLSMMTPRGALVVATMAGTSSIEIGVRPGSELSFHASAQGKVIIAHGPEELRERIIRGKLRAFTAKTVTDPASLAAEFRRISEQGYASAPEQVLLGINSLAAPVFDGSGACIGSIAIVGSIQHINQQYEIAAVSQLKKSVEKVSQKLGFSRKVRRSSSD